MQAARPRDPRPRRRGRSLGCSAKRRRGSRRRRARSPRWSSCPNTLSTPDLVDHDQVGPLADQLGRARSPAASCGLGGERHQHLAGRACAAPSSAAMSGLVTSSMRRRVPSSDFLIFCGGVRRPAGSRPARPPSPPRRRRRPPPASPCAAPRWCRPGPRSTPAGSGSATFAAISVTRGAPGDGGAGERVPLLAGGPVAEEPHRVQRLAGAAGGDHDVPAGQVGRGRRRGAAPGGRRRRSRPGRAAGPCRCRRRSAGPTRRLDHDHAPRARRVATLATVAGCSHISVCMAGREHAPGSAR